MEARDWNAEKTPKMREIEQSKLGGKCLRAHFIKRLKSDSKSQIARDLGVPWITCMGWMKRLGVTVERTVVAE